MTTQASGLESLFRVTNWTWFHCCNDKLHVYVIIHVCSSIDGELVKLSWHCMDKYLYSTRKCEYHNLDMQFSYWKKKVSFPAISVTERMGPIHMFRILAYICNSYTHKRRSMSRNSFNSPLSYIVNFCHNELVICNWFNNVYACCH